MGTVRGGARACHRCLRYRKVAEVLEGHSYCAICVRNSACFSCTGSCKVTQHLCGHCQTLPKCESATQLYQIAAVCLYILKKYFELRFTKNQLAIQERYQRSTQYFLNPTHHRRREQPISERVISSRKETYWPFPAVFKTETQPSVDLSYTSRQETTNGVDCLMLFDSSKFDPQVLDLLKPKDRKSFQDIVNLKYVFRVLDKLPLGFFNIEDGLSPVLNSDGEEMIGTLQNAKTTFVNLGGAPFIESIRCLGGLPMLRTASTLMHELTHAWCYLYRYSHRLGSIDQLSAPGTERGNNEEGLCYFVSLHFGQLKLMWINQQIRFPPFPSQWSDGGTGVFQLCSARQPRRVCRATSSCGDLFSLSSRKASLSEIHIIKTWRNNVYHTPYAYAIKKAELAVHSKGWKRALYNIGSSGIFPVD